jgi:hypothetical protein
MDPTSRQASLRSPTPTRASTEVSIRSVWRDLAEECSWERRLLWIAQRVLTLPASEAHAERAGATNARVGGAGRRWLTTGSGGALRGRRPSDSGGADLFGGVNRRHPPDDSGGAGVSPGSNRQ